MSPSPSPGSRVTVRGRLGEESLDVPGLPQAEASVAGALVAIAERALDSEAVHRLTTLVSPASHPVDQEAAGRLELVGFLGRVIEGITPVLACYGRLRAARYGRWR